MSKQSSKSKYTFARVIRTEMCGGGTSYDVYWRTKDKPSRPLHGGHYYATTIGYKGKEYYRTEDAIDPKARWSMDFGFAKYDAHKRLAKVARRLDIRIARRAFPELREVRALPTLWAEWTLPSAEKTVRVKLQLPV